MMLWQCAPGTQLILASASPRRKELLERVGLPFTVKVSDVDETVLQGETADHMVQRLALRKAWAVANQERLAWTIGADTTVVVDGVILGKPESEAEACEMLRKISGVTHEVVGAFSIINPARAVEQVEVHRTRVTMVRMDEAAIRAYVKSKEPMDKAGSYAIQGIGASLVSSIEGSYTNVVGLNLPALVAALRQLGVIHTVA